MIDIQSELQKLRENRTLRNSTEIAAFELALQRIASVNDVNLVKDLCFIFDDQTQDHEVMFGLVHVIEAFEGEEGLYHVALAIPGMLPRAKEWATILHYRILNHEPSRKLYSRVLLKVDLNVQDTIIRIIEEIKYEDPSRFGNSANEVLSNIE